MTASDRRRFERAALPLLENLYGNAMRLTRDPSEAEDLVQDTMVRAFRFWDTFQEGTNIKGWLFTIQRNTFINGYHRQGRAQNFVASVHCEMRSTSSASIGYSHSTPPGPDEIIREQATREAIAEALAQLPAEYRRAVELADLEGLSYKEIAELMDTPIGTVMSRIYRARKQLHRLLYAHALELEIVADDDQGPGQRRTRYARTPLAIVDDELEADELEAAPQLELAL